MSKNYAFSVEIFYPEIFGRVKFLTNLKSVPTYILLEKVKTLLEWADELLSKILDGLEWILVSENGLFLTLR